MTMPSDVESPMYTTASQEVRAAGAAFCDSGLDDSGARASAVVGGAAGAWRVESLISAGALAESDVEALLSSAPALITPARPTPSSARTLSAATETTPAAAR